MGHKTRRDEPFRAVANREAEVTKLLINLSKPLWTALNRDVRINSCSITTYRSLDALTWMPLCSAISSCPQRTNLGSGGPPIRLDSGLGPVLIVRPRVCVRLECDCGAVPRGPSGTRIRGGATRIPVAVWAHNTTRTRWPQLWIVHSRAGGSLDPRRLTFDIWRHRALGIWRRHAAALAYPRHAPAGKLDRHHLG